MTHEIMKVCRCRSTVMLKHGRISLGRLQSLSRIAVSVSFRLTATCAHGLNCIN